MRRREVITLIGTLAAQGSILWTAAARAEEAAKLPRVGIIIEGSRNRTIDGFVQGMHELGHAEGRDYLADVRVPMEIHHFDVVELRLECLAEAPMN